MTDSSEHPLTPPEGYISVVQDPGMELGYCAIIRNGKVVYAGKISGAPTYIGKSCLMVLNPVDFEDGEAFMKQQLN